MEGGIFLTKGEDEDVARENIDEEDTPPCVDVQEMLFPRIRQGCLDDNLLKKLGMTQCVIIKRDI